jgi:C-terminal processing protease CtpA/Prc
LRRATGSLRTGSEFVARVVREGEVIPVAGKVEPGTEFGMLGLEGETPVIERVPRGTSLWAAGLRPKDRIMSLNGETLEDSASVVLALDRAVPGETVLFGLTRNEERLELRVEAAERKRRSVGKLIVLEDVDDRQRRIRGGMKAGTTDRP